MPLSAKARSVLRNLFSSRRVDVDLDEEVRAHLALLADENIRAGMPPEEAQRAARIELGGIEQVKEQVREERMGHWLASVASDCRYGLRQLREHPGITTIMVFTLALAIGATTAIFSVVYGVLLRPLPYTDPARIMAIFEVNSKGRPVAGCGSRTSTTFATRAAAFRPLRNTATASRPFPELRSRRARRLPPSRLTFSRSSVFSRSSGAISAPATRKKAPAPTVLVSDGYWRQYLGSPRDLSQSHLKIDGAVFSVIGVLPAGFRFPADADLWLPADLEGENPSRTSHNYQCGRPPARRRDRRASQSRHQRDRPAHSRDFERAGRLSAQRWNRRAAAGLDHGQGSRSAAGPARRGRISAAGRVRERGEPAAGAGLGDEQRELAIRSALGAARGRLIRQFLTEALLLSLVGGGLGVLGALWGVAGLVALAPQNLPRLDSVSVSIPVLLFALLLSTAVAAGLGVFTAARATSGDLREGLAEGGRGTGGFARQPARWPGHRGGADRDHAGARGRRGIARAAA